MSIRWFCIVFLLHLVGHRPVLLSATYVGIPVADTTLIQTAPTNNLGSASFVNSGTTQNSNYNRGLFRFNVSEIPRGSRVRAVQLVLEVTREPRDGFAPSLFTLHRMLKAWGEGDKFSSLSPGQGVEATPGEATWFHRFFPDRIWETPGGADDQDFVSTFSSSQYIYGVSDSPYVYPTSKRLVADVQSWVDVPNTNHGWMLQTAARTVIFTARSFGSRENLTAPPRLEVDFVPPPVITNLLLSSNQVHFEFQALPNELYSAGWVDSLEASSGWTTFTNIPPASVSRVIKVFDPTSPPAAKERYYRVLIR